MLKKILRRMYASEHLLLYEHRNNSMQVSPADIRMATLDNISDVLSFDTQKNLEKYIHFLHNGNLCFLGYLDNQCAHRSWVIKYPSKVWLHWAVPMDLQSGEVYIHFCMTAPFARGKNIFPHILCYIADQFAECKKVYICVNAKNLPSIKSIEKAGFMPIKKIFVIAFLNTLIYKKEVSLTHGR